MTRSGLSPMTVLLGVLVVALYQNRVKLLDMLDNRDAKSIAARRPVMGGLGRGQVASAASLSGQLRGPRVREPQSRAAPQRQPERDAVTAATRSA